MRIGNVLSACLLLFGTCFTLAAQSVLQRGMFKAIVVNVQQKAVKNASVTVVGKGYQRKLRTSRAGKFEIALPSGNFKITVEKAGYSNYILLDVTVEPGTTNTYTFNMPYSSQWVHEQKYEIEPIEKTNLSPIEDLSPRPDLIHLPR